MARRSVRDELVFGCVIGARFALPLLILRYPLPGILAAVAVDGDRVILHAFTTVPLDNYQMYDKSLDVFYLSIAYVSTLRNWTDPTAVVIARFLWFYRLFGVAVFALVGDHRLLFLFPAAFEFYFIIYECLRSRWDTRRLAASDLVVIAAMAAVLKLPQEYFLHVARLGTTAWLEDHLLTARGAFSLAALVPAGLLVGVLMHPLASRILGRLPDADHRWTFDADRQPVGPEIGRLPASDRLEHFTATSLIEKVGLVTLVGIVFAEFVPGIDATTVQTAFGLAFLVLANAVINLWFIDQASRASTTPRAIAKTCALNLPVMFGISAAAQWVEASVAVWTALFFVLLASLLIGLHDRYRWRQTQIAEHFA